MPLAARSVDESLQQAFAALSGDRNPMHMDPVAARRTQAGMPVVHGVHTLLWALESLAAAGRLGSQAEPGSIPSRIKVRFVKWVYLGDLATLTTPDESPNPAAFEVSVEGLSVLAADLIYGTPAPAPATGLQPSPAAPLAEAVELHFADLEATPIAGHAYVAPLARTAALFPALTALFGCTVAELAAASYIVGMAAPGLHSMFSRLDLTLQPVLTEARPRTALAYTVASHDERFRKVRIAVHGQGIAGTLDTFLRVPPVGQATLAELTPLVSPGEFNGMRALVIGGSRGLGELTSKLIAAGGGIPTITYALGRTEAEAVVAEIEHSGGHAQALQYDVRQPPIPQLGSDRTYTHLFYFATNLIGRPKPALVTPAILADFVTFYLHGFHDLCVALTGPALNPSGVPLAAYYPSTVYIAERPAGMTEYAMIKAAGEEMIRDMNQHIPNLHILSTRLPRLPTDQTAGILPERGLEPARVLLPILRQMQSQPNPTP